MYCMCVYMHIVPLWVVVCVRANACMYILPTSSLCALKCVCIVTTSCVDDFSSSSRGIEMCECVARTMSMTLSADMIPSRAACRGCVLYECVCVLFICVYTCLCTWKLRQKLRVCSVVSHHPHIHPSRLDYRMQRNQLNFFGIIDTQIAHWTLAPFAWFRFRAPFASL